MPSPATRDLYARARRQHGLVTTQDLRDLGFRSRASVHLVSTGELEKVARGLYRLAGAPVTFAQRALAPCLNSACVIAVCGLAAAALWQLEVRAPTVIDVVAGKPAARSALTGVRIHIDTSLAQRELATIDGIPVTSIQRTIADLAASLPAAEHRALVDGALAKRRVPLAALESELTRMAAGRRAGTRRLRSAIAVWRDRPNLQSPAEAAMMRALVATGVPMPTTQLLVIGVGGKTKRIFLDFAWADAKVALEVDGATYHSRPHRLEADHERDLDLRLLGWTPIRVSASAALADPSTACRAVLSALAQPD